MKLGTVKNLLIATALAPLLGGITFLGCDDEDVKNMPDGGVPDAAPVGDTAVTEAGGEAGQPPIPSCTLATTTVSGNIAVNTTWSCPTYNLKQITYVTNNAVLTIMPGVTVTADPASMPHAALIVTRGARLIANGTKEKPIVFTSGLPAGIRSSGDFGGVALLGSARLNGGINCSDSSTTGACAAPLYWEKAVEGIPKTQLLARYGGNDDSNSCGEMSYVRIEFAGTVLDPDNELNGLTLGACGSATKISHIQVHRGKDDGVEIFGGTVNVDHILVSAGEDDGLDWDNGWRGNAQFVIIHNWVVVPKQAELQNGFEGDSLKGTMNEIALPRSNPQIYNATLIGTPIVQGMNIRRGSRARIRNAIVQNYGLGLANIGWTNSTIVPADEWPAQMYVENSFFFNNGPFVDQTEAGLTTDDLGFDEKAAFELPARKNNFTVDPGISIPVDTTPNYTPTNAALGGQAVPPAPMDTTATYAGAVAPNTPSWTVGWTAFPVN